MPDTSLYDNRLLNRPIKDITKSIRYGNQTVNICLEENSIIYSCAKRCGKAENYFKAYPFCHCNEDCLIYGNCCFDFITECRELFNNFINGHYQKRWNKYQANLTDSHIENRTITDQQKDINESKNLDVFNHNYSIDRKTKHLSVSWN